MASITTGARMTDLFMVAGEVSGDRLGGDLLQEIVRLDPKLVVAGVGGPRMRAAGLQQLFPMEDLQVMGFIDVALSLPHLLRKLHQTAQAILTQQPKVVITIDYPGFNLRLAQMIRKKGYRGKICHYVSPSVWAWGKKRIDVMAKHLDLLLSILPFEEKLFKQTPLRVEYVGHPLARKLQPKESSEDHLIAFFPGSRKKEIERNFPYFIRLIERLKHEIPRFNYVVSLAHENYRPLMQGHPVATPQEMASLRPFMAIAKSGTITLELALQQIPTVVTYALSPLDQLLARYLFKINLPYYALPNLIANKPIFPELIGPALTDASLYGHVYRLIHDPAARTDCQAACGALHQQLLVPDGSERAAQLILSLKKDTMVV